MRGSAFHQANATVAALSSEIQNIKNDLVESINSLSLQINDEPFPPTESMPPLEDQQANATMSNQTALIAAIQELQAQIREMNDKRNINENRGQRRGGYNNRSGRDANRGRRNTSKYCWTHGACAHFSRDCSSPENGHKNEATFENKMGGSTAYCGGRN
jgi:DNA-binding protein H-NS